MVLPSCNQKTSGEAETARKAKSLGFLALDDVSAISSKDLLEKMRGKPGFSGHVQVDDQVKFVGMKRSSGSSTHVYKFELIGNPVSPRDKSITYVLSIDEAAARLLAKSKVTEAAKRCGAISSQVICRTSSTVKNLPSNSGGDNSILPSCRELWQKALDICRENSSCIEIADSRYGDALGKQNDNGVTNFFINGNDTQCDAKR